MAAPLREPLGAGLGLKPAHFEAALNSSAPGLWWELHPENYLVPGGPRLAWLDALREVHPLSLHGVSLSLAGDAPPPARQLAGLQELVRRVQPVQVSEHLAWSFWEGVHLPDLLPFPRTLEALLRLVTNIDAVQSALGRTIAIENPSHYLNLPDHDWDELDFLGELVRRTGCGLLLDVNNVAVSAHNLGYCPQRYLDRVPAQAVQEIHLAGHSLDPLLGSALWIDSHDTPVSPAVWRLYQRLIDRIGPRPTLIERDGQVPDFPVLMAERGRAQTLLQQAAEVPGELAA